MPRCAGLIGMALTIAMSCQLSGCAWYRGLFVNNPYSPDARCQLPPDLPLPQIVAHLNRNATKLVALRARGVKIDSRQAGAMPMSLSASLAVEAPRNFRLVANSLVGPEVDMGSNEEQFWFWARRTPKNMKHVFTASHDRIAVAQQRFPIPFQPDWIIEVMGVIPIDETELTYEPGPPGSHRASLVSQRTSPQGQPVKKVTVVDTCHGLILEHSLYNAAGQLIARAVLSGHYNDATTQTVLPYRIDLEWPQAQLALTLHLGPMDVNPSSSSQTWALPVVDGYPAVDLGQ